MEIMLVGEPMGLFIAAAEGPLSKVSTFTSAVAGAELNVAIGLSRLGHSVGYLTKLGRDSFGQRILDTLEKNNIDSSLVTLDEGHSTGFMLKSKVPCGPDGSALGDPEICYYRRGSASASLNREDVRKLDFSRYSCLHVTGIFPALSASALEAAEYLMETAKERGMRVTFDPNLRPQLWPSQQVMADTLNRLARHADIIMPGVAEGEVLTGHKEPVKIAGYYLARGVRQVIVKTGAKGAYAATAEGGVSVPGFPVPKVVDTVGAGDGFAAGVISAIMEGLSLREAVLRGNAIGAIQVMSVGDNEGLPTREQLDAFMKQGGNAQ